MYPTQSKRYNIGVQGKRLVVRRNVIRERNGDATRGRGLRTNFLDRVAVVGGGQREWKERGGARWMYPPRKLLLLFLRCRENSAARNFLEIEMEKSLYNGCLTAVCVLAFPVFPKPFHFFSFIFLMLLLLSLLFLLLL